LSLKEKNKPRKTAFKKPLAAAKSETGKKTGPFLFLILLLVFFVNLPTLQNGFVWDDEVYITGNNYIKDLSFHGLRAIFSNASSDNYAPVTDVIKSIEYFVGELNPSVYHFGSLLFHLLNVFLVFRFVLLLTKRREIASVAALLFGIHPLQVEAVAWASADSTLYCTTFFLSSLITYLVYVERNSKKMYIFSILFAMLSALSKATAITLPFALLLVDFLRSRKDKGKMFAEKIPFLLLAVITGVVTMNLKLRGIVAMDLPFPERIVVACYGFVTYCIKTILPQNLSVYYPYPLTAGNKLPSSFYGYVIVFLALAVITVYSLRKNRKIAFGMGFFLLNLLLVLQLIPVGNSIIADRYFYLPSIGLFYLAGEGIYLLVKRKQKYPAIAAVAIAALFFSVKSYARYGTWKNANTLWTDVIKQHPGVAMAYYNRGIYLLNTEKYQDALSDFTKTMELEPDHVKSYFNRGVVYLHEGMYDESLADFNMAAALRNKTTITPAELKNGQMPKGYINIDDLNKNILHVYVNRGNDNLHAKKFDEALVDFNKAMEIDPAFAEGYYNRGIVYYNTKKYAEAIADYSKAIELKTNYPEAYFNRGLANYYSGKKQPACLDFQQAKTLGLAKASETIKDMCN
jgi:tetratricopeptide (TPR) repeat protein